MSEYISRDEVMEKAIYTGLCDCYGNMYGAGSVVLVNDIQAIPPSDVFPVLREKNLCRIILRKDGVYDIYDRVSGKWMFSTASAENVFSRLSKMPCIQIDFIDESIPEELRGDYWS